MAINKIQFQVGFSLMDFMKKFPDEQSCQDYLRTQKWPSGFSCRKCSCTRNSIQYRGKREIHECLDCGYQESLLAHTLFEKTRLPLQKWFLAIQILTQAKTCISALELHRQLDVNFKTALLLKHKIMDTLTESEKDRVLENRVECDDAYLGGALKGGKRGRGSENKIPFIAAVQTDKAKHPQKVVLSQITAFTEDEVKKWTQEHISPNALVVSDGLGCFRYFSVHCHHERHSISTEGYEVNEENFKWVNTVLSNVKNAFSGALHAFKFSKYGYRYLGNMQFRFNHRFDLKQCFYDVIRVCVNSFPKTAKNLYLT